jgi:hypothetical protein
MKDHEMPSTTMSDGRYFMRLSMLLHILIDKEKQDQ